MFWAAALLLNLTVTSEDVKQLIIENGGVDILLNLISHAVREQVKTLILIFIIIKLYCTSYMIVMYNFRFSVLE